MKRIILFALLLISLRGTAQVDTLTASQAVVLINQDMVRYRKHMEKSMVFGFATIGLGVVGLMKDEYKKNPDPWFVGAGIMATVSLIYRLDAHFTLGRHRLEVTPTGLILKF
ncbi:MAG: hypothetical protein RIQ89_1801 [Bacteroidota bacterium]|jgi:hypothetical protein